MPCDWDFNPPSKEYFDAQEEHFRRECLGEIKTPEGVIVQQNLF